MGKNKLDDLRANRSPVETTQAIRLQQELLKATCEHCGQVPIVTHTEPDGTRRVKCKGCGRTGKVVVKGSIAHIEPDPPEPPAQEPAEQPLLAEGMLPDAGK